MPFKLEHKLLSVIIPTSATLAYLPTVAIPNKKEEEIEVKIPEVVLVKKNVREYFGNGNLPKEQESAWFDGIDKLCLKPEEIYPSNIKVKEYCDQKNK